MTNTAARKRKLISRLPKGTLTIGIDPDTHDTGIAIASPSGIILADVCRTPRVKRQHPLEAATEQVKALRKHLTGTIATHRFDLAVIESQFIPPNRATARPTAASAADPNDMIALATISGAALMIFAGPKQAEQVRLVKPAEWKGQLDKRIHHERLLEQVPYLECQTRHLGATIRSHALDAAGLAWWGLVELAKSMKA